MKNSLHSCFIPIAFLIYSDLLNAQCASTVLAGNSVNMLTNVSNSTKPVAADKNLNTVIFAHRNDNTNFSGSSGNIRYGISTNAGTTWSTNLGVVNPINSSNARYPNVAIHNPSLNTTPASAYLGYFAPTLSGSGNWDGIVTGVRKLDGTGNTENYNQPGVANYPITSQLVRGGPGTFWSAGIGYSANTLTNQVTIYSGTWTGTDINWIINNVLTIPVNNNGGIPAIYNCNIAFDPTGTIGWLCVLGDPVSGPGNGSAYPLFYKTTNGGFTWSGPELVDYNYFTCITANTGLDYPSLFGETDLAVDVFGNPHLLCVVGVSDLNGSIVYFNWHRVFDITKYKGMWTAYDVAPLNASPGPLPGNLRQGFAPQIARTADGGKLFFSWSHNSTYALGDQNLSPNFFAKGFDVQQMKWTSSKDFTSCNPATNGRIFFPHVAAEVLEPATNQYKLAPVHGNMTSADDPQLPSSFNFLDGCLFNNSDFTIPQPLASYTAQPGLSPAICPGNTISLQVTGLNAVYLWQNGNTSNVNAVSSPGQYQVTLRSGCNVGSATFTVNSLSVMPTNTNAISCAGNTIQLFATGNATSYVWNPGTVSGSVISVSPVSTTVYSVTGVASASCQVTNTVQVTVDQCVGIEAIEPAPTINIFPVPADNSVTITSTIAGEFLLMNEMGQVVKHIILHHDNDFKVELKGLIKGVYILSGIIENRIVQKKIVVR